MPELPEVETVRRQLESALTGARFVAVEAVEPKMLRDCTEDQVRRDLPGTVVRDVGRVGKFLIIALDGPEPEGKTLGRRGDLYLTLHLGMTGQILVTPSGGGCAVPPLLTVRSEKHLHTRFIFRLEKAGGTRQVEFRDARKFGRVHLTEDGPAPRLGNLGPDAWTGDWDAAYLAGRLVKRKAPIKAFLLDQRHLAGIGNIYADETLWWTELSPLRPCAGLIAAEVERLATEIRNQLDEGVRRLGCTLSDFVDTEGNPGTFQEQLRAYGWQGQTCSRCGGTFIRVVVAGRGTTYCPDCQH